MALWKITNKGPQKVAETRFKDEKLLEENYKKGIYQLQEDEIIEEFLRKNNTDLQKVFNNQLSVDEVRYIEQLDLDILETAFRLVLS